MKLTPVAVIVFLSVLVTLPEETHAVPPVWFAVIAAKLGVRLLKNAYYARCNTRYVPTWIRCPRVVYGMGWSRGQAQSAARAYASTFNSEICDVLATSGIVKFTDMDEGEESKPNIP